MNGHVSLRIWVKIARYSKKHIDSSIFAGLFLVLTIISHPIILKMAIYSVFSHEKWWFSIVNRNSLPEANHHENSPIIGVPNDLTHPLSDKGPGLWHTEKRWAFFLRPRGFSPTAVCIYPYIYIHIEYARSKVYNIFNIVVFCYGIILCELYEQCYVITLYELYEKCYVC